MSKSDDAATPTAGAIKTVEYPEHPYVSLNPLCSDEEADALMMNVKAIGIQESIVLWKTGRSTFLLDGRNRLKAFNKLVETGNTTCDNGEALKLPTFYMPDTTTELEALNFVIAKANRRNLNKGQKACAGILAHLAMEKEMKRAKTPLEIPGDRADYVAKMSGSNRLYCVRGFQIHAEATDLFDAVFNAALSMNDAFRRLERRRLNLSDVPENEDEAAAEKDKAKEKEIITDANGLVIEDKRLRKVFVAKDNFAEAVSHINKAKTALYAAAESEGGRHLEVDPLDSVLKDAIKIIRGSQPHSVCPKCSGDNEARKSCENCKKQGWLCQRVAKVNAKLSEDAAGADDEAPKKRVPKAKAAKKPKAAKSGRRMKKADVEVDPVTGEEKPKAKKKKKDEAEFPDDAGDGEFKE